MKTDQSIRDLECPSEICEPFEMKGLNLEKTQKTLIQKADSKNGELFRQGLSGGMNFRGLG